MRQRKFSPRKSSTAVPIGWTHVPPPKPGDRHSWYRCPEIGSAIVENSRLELRRCTFRCRKEFIPKHPNKRSPHTFDVPQELDDGFPESAQLRKDLDTQDRLRNAIVDAVALLALRLQIPVARISQVPLREFILTMIKIGRSITEGDVTQIVNGFSDRIISERMMKIGQDLKENDFFLARQVRYVNVVVDAGTVLGQSVIHSLLTNPYCDEFPIVLSIVQNTHFDKYQYEDLFAKLYQLCRDHELTVCSFITDGLPAQVSGLSMLFEDNPALVGVAQIHCLAHLTNLVFVHSKRQSQYLNAIVSEISTLVALLRTPVVAEELGEKCPSLCPTRWLYLYDVLLWICLREDKLNAFLVASENNRSDFAAIPARWKTVLKILRPLKYLSLAVESSGCALWEAIPLVSTVIAIWKALSLSTNPNELELIRVMMANLIWRFSRASPATIVTSYSLTEHGRRYLREKEVGFQVRGVATDTACFTTDRIKALETLLDDPNRDPRHGQDILISSSPSTDHADDHDEMPDVETQSSLDEEEEETGEETEHNTVIIGQSRMSRRDVLALPLEQLFNVPVYEPTFATALFEIARVGQALGVPAEYCEEKLRSWLYGDRRRTPTQSAIGLSPDTIWRRAPANNEEWRHFSDIALRFITIGASEADCERSLSKQRDIQGLHTTNIRMDTLDARLRALS